VLTTVPRHKNPEVSHISSVITSEPTPKIGIIMDRRNGNTKHKFSFRPEIQVFTLPGEGNEGITVTTNVLKIKL